MNAVDFKSVDLRSNDDPNAGKLAETLHWIDFLDKRKGRVHISGATLGDATMGDILTDGYDAETTTNRLSVIIPAIGSVGLRSRSNSYDAARSEALLLPAGTRQTAMRADNAGRSRTLTAIVPGPSDRAEAGTPLQTVMQVGGLAATRSLHGFLVYVFSELRNADSPLRRQSSAASIEALVTDLVHALHATPTPLPASDNSANARVRAACEYMHAHADQALTVQQIADAVGVGPRHLQSAFRHVTGISPREKLTEIRLDHARLKLTSPEFGTTVTNAALDCGFTHLSRFAATYRHRYGESPSETLRRATRWRPLVP